MNNNEASADAAGHAGALCAPRANPSFEVLQFGWDASSSYRIACRPLRNAAQML
jgi:hypothetical protein